MNLLTDEEIDALWLPDGITKPQMIVRRAVVRAAENAILAKLGAMELPEPESFEAWNAKQHGDPEEIGLLQALRIAYCSGQDSVNVRQAYAQGAAAQLSSEPVGSVYNNHQGSWALLKVHAKDDTPLYTRREAK